MAKTLLQYSCFYILPFLFGVCMCGGGLEDKRFLTAASFEKTQYCGFGKFLLCNPLDKENRSTQVIVQVQQENPLDIPKKQVSVYMKANTATMDDAAVSKLMKEVVDEGWVTFPISGNPITVGENTHYTISVLPGGTTYPNIYFDTPVKMYGYQVGRNVRFLANDISSIVKLKKVFDTCDEFKIFIVKDNENFSYYEVKVNTSSLKVFGGGHILELQMLSQKTTYPFEATF